MEIDTTVAHPARRYDYWLGGTVNFPADRASGDAIAAAFPSTRTAAVENRRFLQRAVGYLRDAGIRQFLDVGTGIPSAGNVHEIAPEARVFYVDNDPIVRLHAAPLLTSQTVFAEGDLRSPEEILAAAPLDFARPIGLLLFSVLHFLEDADAPYRHVATLVDALAPGSYLALSHGTIDHQTPEQLAALAPIMASTPGQFRSFAEVGRFFDGLEYVEPGLVPIAEWHTTTDLRPADVEMWGAVARKP